MAKQSPKEETGKRKKKKKGVTQRPPMESVMIMGPTGKLKMIKRPW